MPTDRNDREKRFLVTGHFRESPGYRVERPRGSHDWLLIYTLDGHGVFSSPKRAEGIDARWCFGTSAHDVTLIGPSVSHCYAVAPDAESWELLWAHFIPLAHWKPWLAWPQVASGIGRLSIESLDRRTRIIHDLKTAHDVRSSYYHYRDQLAINSLESVLLWCTTLISRNENPLLDDRIRECLETIRHRLAEPLSIQELAQACHLSPSRFAHLFKEQMHVTPQKFIEQQRIDRATELLQHSSYSIAQIARRVGFDDPFYFSRRFKHRTGQSPRDCRRGFE